MAHLCEKFISLVAEGSCIIEICKELTSFAVESSSNQLLLGENTTFVELLCKILSKSKYSEDAATIEPLMWLVVRFCRRELMKSTACPSNCDAIVANNGCWQLIEGLSVHVADSPAIAYVACFAMMVLASDSLVRQVALANAGAPLALAAVLFKYSGDARVAEMCCRATRNMAINDEIAALMVGEGICEGLVAVLKSNSQKDSSNIEVVEAALWAVVNLSTESKVATLFGSKGIFDPLMEIFGLYINNPDLIGVVCSVIRNLISDSNYNVSIIYSIREPRSICSLLCDVLRNYPCSICPPDSINNVVGPSATLVDEPVDESVYSSIVWAAANLSGVKQFAHEMMEIFDVKAFVYNILTYNQPHFSSISFTDEDDSRGAAIESCVYLLRNLLLSCTDPEGSKFHSAALDLNNLAAIMFGLFAIYVDDALDRPDFGSSPFALADKKSDKEGDDEEEGEEGDAKDEEAGAHNGAESESNDDTLKNESGSGDVASVDDVNVGLEGAHNDNNNSSSSSSSSSSSNEAETKVDVKPPVTYIDKCVVVTGHAHRFLFVINDLIRMIIVVMTEGDRKSLLDNMVKGSGAGFVQSLATILENVKFDLDMSHVKHVIETKEAVQFKYIDPSDKLMTPLKNYINFTENLLETFTLSGLFGRCFASPRSFPAEGESIKRSIESIVGTVGPDVGANITSKYLASIASGSL